MHTKSLVALTFLFVGANHLTACTVVDETNDTDTTGEQDAAPSDDDTTNGGKSDAGNDDDTTNEPGTTDADASGESNDTSAAGDAGAGDSTDDTDDTDDTDSTDDDETSDGDGGAPDTTDPDEPDDGDQVHKSGTVTLTQTVLSLEGLEIVTSSASAGFSVVTFNNSDEDPTAGACESTTVGSCVLTVCETGDDSDSDEDPDYSLVYSSAGAVEITGLDEDVTLVDNNGTYESKIALARWWSGGEELVASAPGSADVPKFSVNLVAPSSVTVTSPELGTDELSVSRSADLEVTWSDGENGTVSVSVIGGDDSLSRMIACSAPASADGIVVDASLLSDFPAEAVASVSITQSSTKTVDDWSLLFSAAQTVATGALAFED
jgi:hypothetical protein